MTTSPLGLLNKNPGNLRAVDGVTWQGQIGVDAHGFCIFDTAENGLRALCKNLVIYHTRYALSTVRGIVTRWAPPSENNTNAYVTAVANAIGRAPDATLLMTNPATIAALCAAIVNHENGEQPYPATTIAQAARVALGLTATTPEDPTTLPAKPTPAPSPKPPRTERLNDVPAEDLAQLVDEFKAAGASVSVTTMPNGLYSILASYDKE